MRKYLEKKAKRLQIRKRKPEKNKRLRIDGRFASKEQIKKFKLQQTGLSELGQD